MFNCVNWEIVRKTSLMSASFRSREIGSPVNCDVFSAIARGWNVAGGGASGRAPSSCWSIAAAASKSASSRWEDFSLAGRAVAGEDVERCAFWTPGGRRGGSLAAGSDFGAAAAGADAGGAAFEAADAGDEAVEV